MQQNEPSNIDNKDLSSQFTKLLNGLKHKMNSVYHERSDVNKLAINRGMPPFVMREIMSVNPFSAVIPTEFGGLGGDVKESIALMAAASYESLALSLTFGINMALFLQPVMKSAQPEAKAAVLKRFIEQQNMGGLMITEPDFGSDALSMRTSYTENESYAHLQGTKHWAGLTGWADFWLLTARKNTGDDRLARDLDFFICDVTQPNQGIVVEEFFENLGLYQIPYGRNRIDVQIPGVQKLVPEKSGVKLMLDLLHRSRMSFPGMAMGFIQRMLDEAITHCQKRFVSGKNLLGYDQVQQRLSQLQAYFTTVSAYCVNSSKKAGLANDLSMMGVEANAVKSLATDMMQSASQTLLQLVGAKGYKLNHIAGRSTVDSRPFQIFEGSNDMLYSQITESVIKLMRKAKQGNLLEFLKTYDITANAAKEVKELFNFELDYSIPQRKLVEMGQILSRVISLDHVLQLANEGFSRELIDGAITHLKHDMKQLLASFNVKNKTNVIEDYSASSDWLNFAGVTK
ncbi:acyl-CoA dehydrogenase family protein [Carboxylicivirga sp. M1479]|uniref:acyl-CoA dehydrogenase family protein n=1 Tax=Carboxylicivirga sp. M1479 TaxID=2594476 RepID=UPI001178B29F|nr:acyl-CoA dehydrogenase family protein [Carboxylicivirga sp. M1479]TRX66578.1 acyl-CoA dehydrogenase [Carboxylicivirga sp. M1479]